jgi:hypothetical protein
MGIKRLLMKSSFVCFRAVSFAALFLLIGLFPGPVRAERAVIDDVLITPTGDHLLLYCRVKNSFTQEMNRAILSGIATTFTYRIELYRKVDFWWDQELNNLTIDHTIKYNPLKQQFSVSSADRNSQTTTAVKDFDEAKILLTELNGIKLVETDRLRPDETYLLRVRAELNKVRLPLYLHYVLFFVSLWDFKTDWYEAALTYEGYPPATR